MNKWHKKGSSKNLALFAMLGMALTPFNIFNADVRSSRMVPCPREQREEWAPERVRENNMRITVTPESLMGLHLNELLKMVIEEAHENHCLHDLPPGVLTCYEQLENGEQALHVQDLAQALPVVVEKLTQMMKARNDKAPRPDAPAGDGAPVGSLIDCDLTPVLQAIQQLKNIVNQCCAEMQMDFNGVFTALESVGSFTTCCDEILIDITGIFTAIADITVDTNSVFTAIDEVFNTLTTCCEEMNMNFEGTFTAIASITLDTTSVFTAINEVFDTLTACCDEMTMNFDATFTVLNEILTSTCCEVIGLMTDNPPADLPASVDTDLTTTFNVIQWLKAIYIRLGSVPPGY